MGETNSGKSSIIRRYADDIFNEQFVCTIGVDFRINTIQIADKKIKL